jgi:hypothetical protein
VSAPNREQSPDVWWSPEVGIVWSNEQGGFSYVEDGQLRERLVHPDGWAIPLLEQPGCCCGECD